MARAEATPFLQSVASSEESNWCGSAAREASMSRRSRQKVLVIDDKRPRIYPRYRRPAAKRQARGRTVDGRASYHRVRAAFHGLPTAEPWLHRVSTAWQEPSSDRRVTRTKTGDEEMCRADDNDSTEVIQAQSEWKLLPT